MMASASLKPPSMMEAGAELYKSQGSIIDIMLPYLSLLGEYCNIERQPILS